MSPANATSTTSASAAPSSLVTTSETVLDTGGRCPRVEGRTLINLADVSQTITSGCDAYVCLHCGPRKARAFTHAVAWQLAQKDRTRFVTLTQLPDGWQPTRMKMRRLALDLRSEGFRTEWAWTVEKGSKTGMKHAHCTQYGDYIPQDVLQDLWGHRVDIRAVKTAQGVTNYLSKSGEAAVARYLSKTAWDDYEDWLDLTGGRPFHTSRGFFEGRGVRGALTEARKQWRKGEAPRFVVLDGEARRLYQAYRSTGDVEMLAHVVQALRAEGHRTKSVSSMQHP